MKNEPPEASCEAFGQQAPESMQTSYSVLFSKVNSRAHTNPMFKLWTQSAPYKPFVKAMDRQGPEYTAYTFFYGRDWEDLQALLVKTQPRIKPE